MKDQIKIYIVNAFIKDNSGGSPTGIVLNSSGIHEEQMQQIANSLPVSHTAFIIEPTNDNENIRVRFFTAAGEIMNCGHGTIAVHFLRAKELGIKGNCVFNQETPGGIQQVEIMSDDNSTEIFLRQNEIKFSSPKYEEVKKLLTALSINEADLANEYPVTLASPGVNRFLVGLHSAETVKNITPHFDQLKQVCSENNSMGCFVYSILSMSPLEATARMFAPNIGVNEDIINGNSSGCLGAYILQLNARDHLNLSVHQGQHFNQDGIVKVKAQNVDGRIITFIGGTAKITEEFMME